jgi:hypothetical protein
LRLGTIEELDDAANMETSSTITVVLDGGIIVVLDVSDWRQILVVGLEGTLGRTPFIFVSERGTTMVEYHIDMHPAFEPIDGDLSVRARTIALPAGTCPLHGDRICLCDRRLQQLGQDESIFKSCALPKGLWAINGVMPLRSKSQGQGEMCSAFQDRKHGFGFRMTEEQLQGVRDKCGAELAALGVTLTESPGCVFFVYGKNKEGYWVFEDFAKQCSVLMLCFETLYPDEQLVVEVDHSAGHAKHREGALNVLNMNAGFGGKQGRLREGEGSDMKEEDGYLGKKPLEVVFPNKASIPYAWLQAADSYDPLPFVGGKVGEVVLSFNTGYSEMKLGVGDNQQFQFLEGDLPPFDDPLRLPDDTTETRRGKEVTVEGYVGKPKGMKQILWERGMWERGMKVPEMRALLAGRKDFAGEETALQKLFYDRGHLLLFTPKGHPEIAGAGIEYSWGYQKTVFRRDNDCLARNLHANILKAQDSEVNMPLQRVRKFERKARDYRHAYKWPGTLAHWAVEKLRKVSKTHRNTKDQDIRFIMEPL